MRRLNLAFCVLAAFSGSATGDFPTNEVETRGPYRVLEGDFHVHTRFSDGFLSPLDVVLHARRRALDVIAVTEHNMVVPAKIARSFSPWVDGPIILIGEEITTRDHHVIALGLEKAVPAFLTLEKTIAQVHEQGGLAIAAHPVRSYWGAFDAVAEELDGSEVLHPSVLRAESQSWRWRDMVEFWQRHNGEGRPLTAIGSSDYHFFSALGVCRTLVFVKDVSPDSILEALRQRRTVVIAPNGETFGDPELITMLEAQPLRPRNLGPGYESLGLFDTLSRAFVWIALLGLIFLKRLPSRLASA